MKALAGNLKSKFFYLAMEPTYLSTYIVHTYLLTFLGIAYKKNRIGSRPMNNHEYFKFNGLTLYLFVSWPSFLSTNLAS